MRGTMTSMIKVLSEKKIIENKMNALETSVLILYKTKIIPAILHYKRESFRLDWINKIPKDQFNLKNIVEIDTWGACFILEIWKNKRNITYLVTLGALKWSTKKWQGK